MDQVSHCLENTSFSALSNLNTSIQSYQKNLTQFADYVQLSLHKNQSIKCQCRNVLGEKLSELRFAFTDFAEEWKKQMPLVFTEIHEIVTKISELYSKQIIKLEQTNEKWKFAYNQLLKSSSQNSNNNKARIPLSDMLNVLNSKEGQNEDRSTKNYMNFGEINKMGNSLMLDQITQLFGDTSPSKERINSFQAELQEQENLRKHLKNNNLQRQVENWGKQEDKEKDSFWSQMKISASLKSTSRNSFSRSNKQNSKNCKDASIKKRLSMTNIDNQSPSVNNVRINDLRKNLYKYHRASFDRSYM